MSKPKRSRKPNDPNKLAASIVNQVTNPHNGLLPKNPAAVALGRLGGLKGGHARAKRLTAAERSESAALAAKARWAKKRKPK